jgi:Mu transposase
MYTNPHDAAHESALTVALARLPLDERLSWIAEANRLRLLVERYALLKPKRRRNPDTGRFEFVPAAIAICEEAICADPVILAREPHRAHAPSPSTMDGWLCDYREIGLLTFIRTFKQNGGLGKDRRLAKISPAAADWVNDNWRKYRGPRSLYKALSKEAEKEGWRIPSESWLDRRWREAPTIVKTSLQAGKAAYESRQAPYVPRDFSDLEALQILCGDHSERDVTVLLKDGSLARPWLTLWQDLRTGLIWGWHLDMVPSSQSSALAYANGVETFGAQPPPRLEEQFHSYVYTDQGRDYRSHRWDGKVIAVHQAAMRIDGGLEFLCVQRKVGILEQVAVKHLLARRYNAKEKPVERVHRDLSDWEQNTFAEFCGRNPGDRPERWKKLYQEHQRLPVHRRVSQSPFIKFNDYRAQLFAFLIRYNSTEHERMVLGGVRIVPLEEYERLYTTRYEIAPELLALLLMKAEKRTVRKNGVQCFQKNWFLLA